MAWIHEQDKALLDRGIAILLRSITLISDFEEDCWLWNKSTASQGYGKINLGRSLDGSQIMIYSHRLSYLAFIGSIPKDTLCLHICDERRCCNPVHLFLGTKVSNAKDMMTKERGNGQFQKGHDLWVGREHSEESRRKMSQSARNRR